MKKVFIPLWTVVGLFLLGAILICTAAFTTHATDFSGAADLHLRFETEDHKPLSIVLNDGDGKPLESDPQGATILHPKFESRETNIFDTFNNGPHPRTSNIAFFENGHRHEVQFTYDKHGHAWKAELSFPDPSIAEIQLEKSTLEFKGLDGPRRRYESAIFAKALVGPPIIKND
jgi:hypothetical protein